jgi:hypothetical protein
MIDIQRLSLIVTRGGDKEKGSTLKCWNFGFVFTTGSASGMYWI